MLTHEFANAPRAYDPDIEDIIGGSLHVTLAPHERRRYIGTPRDCSWAKLATVLTTHKIGSKSGPCIMPAAFKGNVRRADEAIRCDVVMLDIDGGSSLAQIESALKAKGWAGAIASTYSHTPKNPKFRVCVPLARPWQVRDYATNAEAQAAWKRAVQTVAAELGIRHDKQCEDVSRLFFLPRRRKNGTKPQASVIEGAWCDPWSIESTVSAESIAPISTTNKPRKSMDAAERLNSLALRHIADWAPVLYPEGRWAADAWRVRSADLGREFEEDLSIHPAGIRDNGPEQGFTAINLVRRDFSFQNGEPERIEHDDWEEAGRTLPGADFDTAATWLAEQLGESWQAMQRASIASKFDDLGEDDPAEASGVEIPKSGLRFLDATELVSLPQPLDFVEGVLFDAQLSTVYGEPGTGKSTFVLDIALHAASGRAWNGRQVERGGVLFIALEGMSGVRNRFLAWCRHCEMDPSEVPAKFADGALDIRTDKRARKAIISICEEASRTWGLPVRLIVIDTLARAMAGGDENSSQDMGAAIAAADAIRQATGAHVTVIHHSGKDASKGARGHSSLRGAVDTEIELKGSGAARVAAVTKQKDAPCEGVWRFRLESVPTGEADRRGKPITGAVAVSGPDFEDLGDEPDVSPSGRAAIAILAKTLESKGRPAGDIPEIAKNPDLLTQEEADKIVCPMRDWQADLKAAGWGPWNKADNGADKKADNEDSAERTFRRAKKELRDKGLIGFSGPNAKFVWLGGQATGQQTGQRNG